MSQRIAVFRRPVLPFVNATTFHFMPQEGWKWRKQMPSLVEFVRTLRVRNGYPVVLVGDFNTDPDSDEIRYLKGQHTINDSSAYFADAWERAGDGSQGATWSQENDYSSQYGLPDRRIDYIFVGAAGVQGAGAVQSCRVVCNESKDGVWPSDHFGVFAELSVGKWVCPGAVEMYGEHCTDMEPPVLLKSRDRLLLLDFPDDFVHPGKEWR